MQTITVSKERLLSTLKTNRDEHEGLFIKAQEVYREKFIEALERRLADARAGGKVSTFFNLPEPVNYTDEFDKAIGMVEWAEGATIEMTERDFQRFVRNQWEWAAAFEANTKSYIEE